MAFTLSIRGTTLVFASGAAFGVAIAALLRRLNQYRPPEVWKEQPESNPDPLKLDSPKAGARREKPLPVGAHPIQLYSLGTPNGCKVTIMLEEICATTPSFDYDAWRISIMDGEQFDSGFVDVSPNSKIPAMVDTSTGAKLFESGAILIYLAEKFPSCGLLPSEPVGRASVLSWLMWQMGSAPLLGRGFGQFYHYSPVKIESVINQFTMETKRLLHVLDLQLAKHPYVAGQDYSIADIAIWPWYGRIVLGRSYPGSKVFLNVEAEYPNVVRWAKHVEETRSAVRRGQMVNVVTRDSKLVD